MLEAINSVYPNSYRVAKSDNPLYWINIMCPGHGFNMQADMPEQLAIAITSDWESRLPSTVGQMLSAVTPGSGDSKIVNLLGVDSTLQYLSFSMWAGTSPVEIPITILMDAEKSGFRDVYEPLHMLQSLIFPVNGGNGMLHPPGPRWGGSAKVFGFNNEGYGVHIKIGRMMYFMDCILVSASSTIDSRLDNQGFPTSAQVECVIRTGRAYGRTDWLNATFPNGGRGVGL